MPGSPQRFRDHPSTVDRPSVDGHKIEPSGPRYHHADAAAYWAGLLASTAASAVCRQASIADASAALHQGPFVVCPGAEALLGKIPGAFWAPALCPWQVCPFANHTAGATAVMDGHAVDVRELAALVVALNDLSLLVQGVLAVLGPCLAQNRAYGEAGGQVDAVSAALAAPLVAAEEFESGHVDPAFLQAFQRAWQQLLVQLPMPPCAAPVMPAMYQHVSKVKKKSNQKSGLVRTFRCTSCNFWALFPSVAATPSPQTRLLVFLSCFGDGSSSSEMISSSFITGSSPSS